MSEMTIRKAIRERKKLQFLYDGNLRIVNPHVYGQSSKNKVILLGIQTGGYTSRGALPDWRMFETVKIQNMQLLDEVFSPAYHIYNPFDSHIEYVYERVG